jgi:cobyrinic acid a,c-diamide synthase
MPGFVIAGTHSGSGKTTVTLGIMAALSKKGYSVQPFKAGPDFIDSGLHKLATGRVSRNLDLWMCGEEYVRSCYTQNGSNTDISVVEGVMGLYDGDRSTAHLAAVLRLPVILVVDGYGMAESAGPMVKGFYEWPIEGRNGEPVVQGVIFNRVASAHHYDRLCRAVKDVPVLGYLPRDIRFAIPHRHLGLLVAEEDPISKENIDRLAEAVIAHIDMNEVLALAKNEKTVARSTEQAGSGEAEKAKKPVRIAVAADQAFSFYYQDNLDLLQREGGQIVFFSPLADTALPEAVDAVYLGGGYPELYAQRLSHNGSMKASISEWARTGGTIYAECGGFMYLTKSIRDFEGNVYGMTGVFPFTTAMKQGRAHLGYRELCLSESCALGKEGEVARGHEFHYSEIEESQQVVADRVYRIRNGSGDNLPPEGYRYKRTLGSYVHIHFGSNPTIAARFIEFAQGRI